MNQTLPVVRAAQIQTEPVRQPWLIHALWSRNAAGILGGPPKCCKSWLGLDMAVSVASATDCLGHFPVEQSGPTLIYMAEDALPSVRERIQAICSSRSIELASLELYAIDTPTLRLDLDEDQKRLIHAIERIKPRLLLLDPLVRMHRADENSAQEMSRLLGFLRDLQRRFELAVVLVHHTSKKSRSQPGQALRGSSDLHAWTDSSAYLMRKADRLLLTVEHRCAGAPEPFFLNLVSDPENGATHLEVDSRNQSIPRKAPHGDSLSQTVFELIDRQPSPMTRAQIRNRLKIRNQTLGSALCTLESCGKIRRSAQGWLTTASKKTTVPKDRIELAQPCLPFQGERNVQDNG